MPAIARYRITRVIEVEIVGIEDDIVDAITKAEQIFLNPTPNYHSFAHTKPVVIRTNIEKM